jgi:predicted RND superfamily exporter protein
MEATIFKFAFFVLIGLAILSLSTMVVTFIVILIRAAWLSFKAHTRTAETEHVWKSSSKPVT